MKKRFPKIFFFSIEIQKWDSCSEGVEGIILVKCIIWNYHSAHDWVNGVWLTPCAGSLYGDAPKDGMLAALA